LKRTSSPMELQICSMPGSDGRKSIRKGAKMKPLKLIISLMLPVVTLLGCKDKTASYIPRPVEEKLALRVLTLQYQARESSMQVAWFKGRLEKCLSELEKDKGLEPIPFDWAEAMGLPKFKRDPNHPERYASKPRPFYTPYRGIKRPEIKIERYRHIEKLSSTVSLTNSTLENNMLGMDKYIKHLEERLKRLEEHLNK